MKGEAAGLRWQAAAQPGPGRVCPVEYRYPPKVFDRAPEIVADTLYVVGGLYGNVIRMGPPLNLTEDEAREGVDILTEAIASVSK